MCKRVKYVRPVNYINTFLLSKEKLEVKMNRKTEREKISKTLRWKKRWRTRRMSGKEWKGHSGAGDKSVK